MHYLLFYNYSPDYLERRGQFRGEHLKLAWAAAERGELVLGGVLTEPIDTGLLMFVGDSPDVVERFVAADPYMANGLVVSYRVRRWDTVVGELAANLVR